jgi:hypothetical protein
MASVYPDVASVLRDICRAIGRPTDDAVIRSLEAQRLALKAAPFAGVDRAVLEALHDIRHMGVKIGVISNCAPEEVAAWSTSALPACCDDAVFSCQVSCAKPGADIYRLVGGLGWPPRTQCSSATVEVMNWTARQARGWPRTRPPGSSIGGRHGAVRDPSMSGRRCTGACVHRLTCVRWSRPSAEQSAAGHRTEKCGRGQRGPAQMIGAKEQRGGHANAHAP